MERKFSSSQSPHFQHIQPNSLSVIIFPRRSQPQLAPGALRRSLKRIPRRNSKFSAKNPKLFRERDAFPSSLPLHEKNPHRVLKDIQRFARQDKLEEALTILDYLDQQGIPVNATTFAALLAACVRRKSLAHGKQVHVHILINGLEGNEFLRARLVEMYTACGSVEDAQKLFDGGASRNVYSWNALLRGTVISGNRRYRDVLSTFVEMRELGVDLNVYSFSNVIKSFAGAAALRQGLKTHALLIKNGLLDSSILKTSLIDLYFKCGKVRLAGLLFDEVIDRDIVAWGAMIAGFAHNRLHGEALDFARMMICQGIYPNSVVLTTILPVLGEVKDLRLGKEVHAFALKSKNYSTQTFIQSGLIDLYCKFGDMASGRRVFYGLKERNIVSWTALMSGYVSNGRLEQALRSIVWMQQEGFRPDVVTVATVLPVCAELRALKQGKEIHAYAIKNLLLPNVAITTSLMVMYSKCSLPGYSFRLFDGMEQRNVKAWTAMIDSYVQNGLVEEGINVFRAMQLSKHRPDSVAMARALAVTAELKALRLGKELHGHILKKELVSIPFVSAQIIKMYGSCGAIQSAKFAFEAVNVKGSVTWNAIIEAYGHNGLFQDAIDHFDLMMTRRYKPNPLTFVVVLSICDRAGWVDKALQIFNEMHHKHNLQASVEHHSLVARLLARNGGIEEAQRFSTMGSLSSQL